LTVANSFTATGGDGGSAGAGGNAFNAVNCNKIEINGLVKISSGKGGNSGKDAGEAAYIVNSKLNFTQAVEVYSGSGGSGSNGVNTSGDLNLGKVGGAGGKTFSIANNSNITLNNFLTITAVTGGAGVKGGHFNKIGRKGGDGGSGGVGFISLNEHSGGDGGNGGIGSNAFDAKNSTLSYSGPFMITAGAGGNGGYGGEAGNNSNGGNGGEGGDGGNGFNSLNSFITFNDSFKSIAGAAGLAGNAGNGKGTGVNGNNGNPGASGTSLTATDSTLSFGGDVALYVGSPATIGDGTFTNSKVTFNVGDTSPAYKGNINFDANSTLTIKTKYNEDSSRFGSIDYSKGTLNLSSLPAISIDLSEDALPKVGGTREGVILNANGGIINAAGVVFSTAVNADHVALVSAVVTKSAADYKLTHRIKEEFADGVTVDLALEAANAGLGALKFAGGATINQSLGKVGNHLNSVTFAANDSSKVIKLNAGITAGELILGKATYKPTNNVTLTSVNANTTKLKSPTFDLGT
jgi:hypothetical protein